MSAEHVMLHRSCLVYVKAATVRGPSDVRALRGDMREDMILIVRIAGRARVDAGLARDIVADVYAAAKEAGAGIARLGGERIIVTPSSVRIWRPAYEPA